MPFGHRLGLLHLGGMQLYDDRFSAMKVLSNQESVRRSSLALNVVSPVLIAEPWEPWRHMAALVPGAERRRLINPAIVRKVAG